MAVIERVFYDTWSLDRSQQVMPHGGTYFENPPSRRWRMEPATGGCPLTLGPDELECTDTAQGLWVVFKRESQKAHSQALAFEHTDAAGQYRVLAARYSGTKWSDFSRTRAQEVAAQSKLHAELIKRVNAAAKEKRELPFVPPGVPEAMAKMKWRILEATDRNLSLAAGRDDQFERPVTWGSWKPNNLLDIFDLYFPKPTAEEAKALSYFCTERKLDARAQQYLNNAGQ